MVIKFVIFSYPILGYKLQQAWSEYVDSCECGHRYSDNCAHYLSNALIKGGFSDLDGGNGADLRNVSGRIVCCSGRPIRAKELRAWAQAKWGQPKSSRQDGINFVYQERRSDSQGHVLLKNISDMKFKGTGDFPPSKFEIQEYYY